MHFEKFLITHGDSPPEVWCESPAETLEANVHQCAEETIDEDIRLIRVWRLTPVEVTNKAFKVQGIERTLKESE